jgi:dTDP-4-dehydrorhamnose 3,5-epimerase
MKSEPTALDGVFLLHSPVWGDERGFFREWYKGGDLGPIDFRAQQANLSFSDAGVIRGLHYSLAAEGQAKIVTCVYGELDDVVVDIREGSPTFGQHVVIPLAANNGLSVYLPAGVAHGFSVPRGLAGLSYLLSSPYNAAAELEIHPFDDDLAVAWTVDRSATLSEKDAAAPTFRARRDSGQLPYFR